LSPVALRVARLRIEWAKNLRLEILRAQQFGFDAIYYLVFRGFANDGNRNGWLLWRTA
jgi:hypothetical protein